jgi:signal transduction histidine kinase
LQAQQRLLVQRWAETLSETTAALVTTFDVSGLVSVVSEQFPRLGIKACYVALGEANEGPKRARLLLAYDRARQIESVGAETFDVREIVPRLMERGQAARAWIVEPLSFKEEQLGYAVFEMGPREGSIYEALRDQLSGALKGALLMQQVVEQDRERQRLMQDSERRAAELESAYRALQQNQEQLVTANRMASLGRLTANIAHEINTPLAAVRAALANLTKLVTEYELSYRDAAVTPEDHADIAAEMRAEMRIADSAAERAAQFVRGIKTQTRMLEGERAVFNAVPYVREALSLLTHSLRRANCRSIFETSSDQIEISGSPGRLAQVVTNLVANAMDATSERGGGDITIRLKQSVAAVELEVADHGIGIAPEVVSQIFEPMFTTKPFGQGTGLGLAIVKDIVTGDLGGAITVESELGRGTTFVVRLPTVGS